MELNCAMVLCVRILYIQLLFVDRSCGTHAFNRIESIPLFGFAGGFSGIFIFLF